MKILSAATVWLRRIVDIALITLILVVLAGVVLGKIVPLTGRETLAIGGRSMEPAIPIGAAVVVVPVDPANLAPGDVVSMRVAEANAIFTHRIEAVVDRPDGRYVRTKGDANPDADPTLVKASAIIGRVELSIPYMGYLLALLSIPTGVIFVVGLVATLLAIAWLLESLEPIPGPDRRRAVVPSTGAATAGAPSAGGSSGPALPPLPVLRPAPGPLVLALVAPGTRTPLVRDPAGRARPSAREQIARSRSARDRRLRWRAGHSETTAE
jgi:signal peptidase I